MSQAPTISLVPVSADDIATLVAVHHEAFATNALTYLMYGPADPVEFSEVVQETLSNDSTARLTKAVDSATGEILGWSLWNSYMDAESHAAAIKAAEERVNKTPKYCISPALYKDLKTAVIEMRKRWIAEKPASVLNVLVVHPRHQGKGVGKALVTAGLEEAHRQGLLPWLEATPEGYPMYQKLGFRDVENPLAMDLAKYGGEGVVSTFCMMHELQ